MIKIKVVIRPLNDTAVENLKKLVEQNKKILFKLLRLGSKFTKISDKPYVVHYTSKYYNKFGVNSAMGETLKEPLKVAVLQTLKSFNMIENDVEVSFIDY